MAKLAELAKQQEELKKQLNKNAFYKRAFGGGIDLGILFLDEDGSPCMTICYYADGDFGTDTEAYDDYGDIAVNNWEECTKEEATKLWAKAFRDFVEFHIED